jgi:DNA polymerase III delta prime subunit
LNAEIKKYIKLLIEIDNIHILLTGNKCSGKTTMIQAIIRNYYGKDHTSIRNDILFINNLKEQGIVFYRNELKRFVSRIRPYTKTVVIDDMDIVPEYVQHIIRNYIDKYKNNVNFIMSCITKKRVIDSIQSRLAIVRLDIPADISPLIRKNSRCREYRVDREYREFSG